MRDIIDRFALEGLPISCERYGSGHINETYLLVTNRPHLYILQKVNRRVFPDAEGLMRNILLVTEHLRRKDPDPRHSLSLVPTREGGKYLKTEDGDLWRLYEFVTGSLCLDRAETPADLGQSGAAFGRFQQCMADFPSRELCEVLPGFHDTPARYRAFREALRADPLGRAAGAEREIDFYLEREKDAGFLKDLLDGGRLPLRVTHNDTKLNNVLLDDATRKPLCVIDLDTVMPGLAASDFGDAVRFGASTAAEDERDLEKVHFSRVLYESFREGFLYGCGDSLTPIELETLPDGARLMTLECGVRFLTDHLLGDVYFQTTRPGQNLDRARTQMKLTVEMEQAFRRREGC